MSHNTGKAPTAEGGSLAPDHSRDDPSNSAPTDPLGEAQAEIERLKNEVETGRDLYLRDRAELDNFKKRMQRERADLLRYANEPLLRDLVPVIDNLERALQHAGAGSEALAEGVNMVLTAFIETLDRHGVKRVEALGSPFDPTKHEAIAHVASDEHQASHVAQQHQVGYQLHDRLIRPALVSVSKGKTQ